MVVLAATATGLILLYLSQSQRLYGMATATFHFLSPTLIAFTIILVGFYFIRASAQGVLAMTSRNAIGKWFDYHRGLALAISGVVTSFMFSLAPRLLKWMNDQLGWQGTWFCLGWITLLVMGGLGWLFYRDNPEECGLVMDGSSSKKERKTHADAVIHRDLTRAQASKTWAFWTFNLSFAFYALFGTAFTFHIESLGNEAGRNVEDVVGYFFPMACASVLTNLFCGWISPRVRLKYLLLMMNLAGLAGVIGLIFLSQGWGAALHILGNGMVGGAFSALSGIVWPRFYGRKWLGAISGLNMSFMVIASGIGPLVFSLFYRFSGDYQSILIASLIVPIALAIGSLWADNPQQKLA